MAVIPYDRITNLQNDQALNPTDPYPAPDMDAEYNALKITTDDLIQHLALIQRDDGHLANGSVGRAQLDPAIVLGFGEPTQWASGVNYVRGDTVFASNSFYFCEIDHLSAVFAADLALGRWSLLANFTQSTTDAQTAATASAASATASATSATNAATSASNAAASASAAVAVNAFPWSYDTSVTMADPGTGKVRLNNAALTSVSQLVLSSLSLAPGNPDVSDWIVTWDDSTSTTKGTITLRKNASPQNFAIYRVTGTVTDAGAFVQLPVAYVTHAGSFASTDQLNVEFARAGDAGTTTVVGGITDATSDGTIYGRRNAAWTAVVAASALTTAVTPAGAISSTNVQAALQEIDSEKVAKAGDTMAGTLVIQPATGNANLNLATTVDAQSIIQFYRIGVQKWQLGNQLGNDSFIIYSTPTARTALSVDNTTALATLFGDPTAALGIATKQYVDLRVAVIRHQIFTVSGTYTPNANLLYAIVECVGGGGAGGGPAGTANQFLSAGGGGSGAYSRKLLTKAAIGASRAVTIGAGGGPVAGSYGGSGGQTAFSTLCTAFGGVGGPPYAQGGGGGGVGVGDVAVGGSAGTAGFQNYSYSAAPSACWGGAGAGGPWGGGGQSGQANGNAYVVGYNATGYGSGGGGGNAFDYAANIPGGYGSAGICIVTEFCSQ